MRQPLDLQLGVNSVSELTLTWKRNGNKQGTIFQVNFSANGTSWDVLDVTTSAKLKYQGTAGTAVWFRVWAKRAGQTSPVSLPISMWYSGGNSLSVAA